MDALDTNVLLRFLLDDDSEQGPIARQYISKNCTQHNPAFIGIHVLCEAVWVLDRFYEFSKSEICSILDAVLSAREFEIESEQIVLQSYHDYQKGKADFADYLIKNSALNKGAQEILTFDKKAAREAGFMLLS